MKKALKENILVLNKESQQKNINRDLLFEFRGVNGANWKKAQPLFSKRFNKTAPSQLEMKSECDTQRVHFIQLKSVMEVRIWKE